MLDVRPLDRFSGRQVTDAWVGVGSFLVLDFGDEPGTSIWIYLADWAIVDLGDQETLASDALPERSGGRLPVKELVELDFIEAVQLDDEEFHLLFSNGFRLEIWENRDAYGPGAEALHLFDTDFSTTLRF